MAIGEFSFGSLCWIRGGDLLSWKTCCHPALGPNGHSKCWNSDYTYSKCCLSNPEIHPMLSSVLDCPIDTTVSLVHVGAAFVHDDTVSLTKCFSRIACQPCKTGWEPVGNQTVCDDGRFLSPSQFPPRAFHVACNNKRKPFPLESWQHAQAFDRIRAHYRFGTAARSHCAVPNFELLQEETLRLYSFLKINGLPLSRIVVNIGSGDGSLDDPLNSIVTAFAGTSINVLEEEGNWHGVYFDATPGNCKRAQRRLRKVGHIRMKCGFVTPQSVVSTLCEELGSFASHGDVDSACQFRGSSPSAAGAKARVEVDAMNLDIDSYDCAVLREVLKYISPKILILEAGYDIPPPLSFAAEYHPKFDISRQINVSWKAAVYGGTIRSNMVWGCSLSAAVELLWSFGLGLYRMSTVNSMFVRVDVATVAGLADGETSTSGKLHRRHDIF